jgi:nucleoid DNA-binding protein
MNKIGLKNQIYSILKNRTPKITRAVSNDVVDIIIDVMGEAIINTQRLAIRQFGVFEIKHRKARLGWNPAINKHMTIQSRARIKFKPSEELTRKINL